MTRHGGGTTAFHLVVSVTMSLAEGLGAYHFTAASSTHWGCADLCGANASLACVQSFEENEYVARLAADADTRYFWIGNYQRPDGEEPGGGWDVCQSGEPAGFSKWDVNSGFNEPSNYRGEECALVGYAYLRSAASASTARGWWHDAACYLEAPCLCKLGADPSPEYMAFAEGERKRDKSLREAALVLQYISLVLCSFVSGLSLLWALVCIIREIRRMPEQSMGKPGLEMVQNDASLAPHDKRVYDSLLSGDIQLLRCSWLRSRPRGYVLPRRQDLPSEALLPPAEAAALFARQDRSVSALTYGCAPPRPPSPAFACLQQYPTPPSQTSGLTPHHPDPHGENLQHVVSFLNSPTGQVFVALFWDFAGIFQARSPSRLPLHTRTLRLEALDAVIRRRMLLASAPKMRPKPSKSRSTR